MLDSKRALTTQSMISTGHPVSRAATSHVDADDCIGVGRGRSLGVAVRTAARVALPVPLWFMAGAVFVGVELVAHAALALRQQPSFLNGEG